MGELVDTAELRALLDGVRRNPYGTAWTPVWHMAWALCDEVDELRMTVSGVGDQAPDGDESVGAAQCTSATITVQGRTVRCEKVGPHDTHQAGTVAWTYTDGEGGSDG